MILSIVVKHVCHSFEEKDEPCLLEIFILYIVETHAKEVTEVTALYFKPSKTKFAFDKVAVGINSLNKSLPKMCEVAGFKRKTAHSLHVTCVSLPVPMLGLKKKFIRERSGIALLHCFSTKSLQKKMCPKFQISSVHVSLLQVHVLVRS